jgi:hypothetical protein
MSAEPLLGSDLSRDTGSVLARRAIGAFRDRRRSVRPPYVRCARTGVAAGRLHSTFRRTVDVPSRGCVRTAAKTRAFFANRGR